MIEIVLLTRINIFQEKLVLKLFRKQQKTHQDGTKEANFSKSSGKQQIPQFPLARWLRA